MLARAGPRADCRLSKKLPAGTTTVAVLLNSSCPVPTGAGGASPASSQMMFARLSTLAASDAKSLMEMTMLALPPTMVFSFARPAASCRTPTPTVITPLSRSSCARASASYPAEASPSVMVTTTLVTFCAAGRAPVEGWRTSFLTFSSASFVCVSTLSTHHLPAVILSDPSGFCVRHLLYSRAWTAAPTAWLLVCWWKLNCRSAVAPNFTRLTRVCSLPVPTSNSACVSSMKSFIAGQHERCCGQFGQQDIEGACLHRSWIEDETSTTNTRSTGFRQTGPALVVAGAWVVAGVV